MYALHPLTVHFPLGLLLASGLFTLIGLRRAAPAWEASAYHCLLVGWLAGVVALASGTYDALRQLAGPDLPRDGALVGWVNAHAFINLAGLIIYGQALLLRRRGPAIFDNRQTRRAYLARQAVGALLLVVGGWIGGHLVYVLRMGY
jgi:uncharacterized membrane protein